MLSKKIDRDINNLILSTQKAMTEFAEGRLPLDKAGEEYQKLSGIYQKIEDYARKSEGPEILRGLCYYHNIENFSLLSGVYILDAKEINPMSFYGDNSLNVKAMERILKNRDDIKKNQIIMIPSDDTLLHPVYVCPVSMDKKDQTLLAAVSSSTYFSKDKFYYTGQFLNILFSIRRNDYHYIKTNYFDEISKEIEKIIRENIDAEHLIEAALFIFRSVENNFGHLGIKTLLDVSGVIADTLKRYFQENSRIFTLSIKDYIVITRKRRGEEPALKKKKFDFLYKNINIPYKTLKIEIDTVDSIHNFWEKLLLFENYLDTGDIIR